MYEHDGVLHKIMRRAALVGKSGASGRHRQGQDAGEAGQGMSQDRAQASHRPTRISRCFSACRAQGRAALVTFVTAGDPDAESCAQLLNTLPDSGADIIELGMPFSDPMAEGPPIQMSSARALAGGQTMQKTLQIAAGFRRRNDTTPLILMGYYNPVYRYGAQAFVRDAHAAGVDGLIIVDLPPESAEELAGPIRTQVNGAIDMIRLATPTTDKARLPVVLAGASGFLYYVSIAGVTGTATPDLARLAGELAKIRCASDLPVAVGFGIRTPDQARQIARFADGVVVGSAIVEIIRARLEDGTARDEMVRAVGEFVSALAGQMTKTRPGS